MPDVLFIPSDHGGGMGHVSRCLYLGRVLRSRGNKVGIVLEPGHFSAGVRAGLETYLLDTRKERWIRYQWRPPFRPVVKLKTRLWKTPVFVEFSSLAYQVPRDGYVSEKIVRYRFKILSQIVAAFRPHVLVGDTHFLTRLLGLKFSIPVVQITRSAGFPVQPQLIWWKAVPRELIEPDAVAPFRPLLQQAALQGIRRAEDLLRGNRYLIPSIPEIEPVHDVAGTTCFCGPLASVPEEAMPDLFPGSPPGPRIYVSIGGGAGRSGEKQFFHLVIEAFAGSPFRVLVSTGKRVSAKHFHNVAANVRFREWVNGPAAVAQSDLVIFHGGYGTFMEALLAAKPTLVVPSHTEQEGNGRRLETLRLGKTLLLHSPPLKPLVFQWPYGRYQMLGGFHFALKPAQLREAAEEMLETVDRASLDAIQQKLKKTRQSFDIEKALAF